MSSRLENILEQKESLSPSDTADLLGWLDALRADIRQFGATDEDLHRIAKIKIKLHAAQSI